MDAKKFFGRSIFFLIIVIAITAITTMFGDENMFVGVAIVVIAMMMLQKDLSVRPVWNTGVLTLFVCILGIGSFVSLFNPFLGFAVNILIVLLIVFVTVHDLDSPLHFPFVLGYAFLLSIPVTWEQFPIRMLALIVGSVATVALNVLLNRNRMTKTSHNAVISLCNSISDGAKKVSEGDVANVTELEKLCSALNSNVYDRLRDRFFASPRDATVIELMSSLVSFGRAVFEKEKNPRVLKNVSDLMGDIVKHEDGEKSLEEIREDISRFIEENQDADFAILASAETISSELERLSQEGPTIHKKFEIPSKEKIVQILKENCRRDSVRFTFAVRLSLVFSFWAFVWQYWDLENARWLLYTTAALVQPYIEGTWKKSGMRVVGTLIGAAIYAVTAFVSGEDTMILLAVLLIVGYVYTVYDPVRYDIKMIFVTIMALLAAALMDPRGDVLVERLAFILMGVVAALMANMLILPYRLKDENVTLGRRYLNISSKQIEFLRRSAVDETPSENYSYLLLKANAVSIKMQMNDEREAEHPFSGFISEQNALTSECNMLRKSLENATSACRKKVSEIIVDRREEVTVQDCEGLSREESEILKRTANMMTMYRENRMRLADAALLLPD